MRRSRWHHHWEIERVEAWPEKPGLFATMRMVKLVCECGTEALAYEPWYTNYLGGFSTNGPEPLERPHALRLPRGRWQAAWDVKQRCNRLRPTRRVTILKRLRCGYLRLAEALRGVHHIYGCG